MRLAFIVGLFLVSAVHAQFKAVSCKTKDFAGQTCLVKEFEGNEVFTADDLMALRQQIEKLPAETWLKVIDSDKQLFNVLNNAKSKITRKEDKTLYAELMVRLELHPNPSDFLEASALYLKNNPAKKFYFSHKDPQVLQKFLAVLNDEKVETPSYSSAQLKDPIVESLDQGVNPPVSAIAERCQADQAAYRKIMDRMVDCEGELTGNALSLYTVLAEIIACEDYGVEQVGLIETSRTRGLRIPNKNAVQDCLIAFKGASASIGLGEVELKINGQVQRISWAAGHDLTNKNNTIAYWRNQLIPQIQDLFKTDGKLAPKGVRARGVQVEN